MEQQSNQISSGNNAPDELSKMQGEEVAKRHGLDLNRVMSVLERCSNASSPFLAPLTMYIDRAIGLIGKDKAFTLFESEHLAKLTKRIFWVDGINLSGQMTLYSLDQLVYFPSNSSMVCTLQLKFHCTYPKPEKSSKIQD